MSIFTSRLRPASFGRHRYLRFRYRPSRLPRRPANVPADKVKANAREAVKVEAVGVSDTTLGAIDLGKEKAKIKGRELRFRKMVIQPGGVVPWHSHDDRPALIYVAEGEILEFASNCAARSITRPATSAPRSTAPRIGGRISATTRWSCSSATCVPIRTTIICDGCPSPCSVTSRRPASPRRGAAFCCPTAANP